MSVIVAHSAPRTMLKVDLSLLTPVTGAITALPLVVMLAVSLHFSTGSSAIAMAVGANLVAVVSLVGAPRLSLRLALLDAVLMGIAVFIGTITVPSTWLHVLLLVPWCFGAGMLVVFGQTQAAIGTQAIIAYVVLGRFAGSALAALHLSLFVVGGALIEVLALVILRLPPTFRHQRNQIANAFETVAELARSEPSRPATDFLSAIDSADLALSAPSLFSRTDVQELRAVLNQVRRVRLELTTLAGLRQRLGAAQTGAESGIRQCTDVAAHALELIGVALRNAKASSSWSESVGELRANTKDLEGRFVDDSTSGLIMGQCVAHLNAIRGQLRSAGAMIEHLNSEQNRRAWRPSLPSLADPNADQLLMNFSLIRENFSSDSSAFRHAVRLAVVVPLSTLLGSLLGLPRGYWLPFAVAVILKPDYSTLVKRGLGRLVGTMLGATIAAVLASEFSANRTATLILVAVIAWLAYSTWAASFSVAIGFVTALILILLSISSNDTIGTALDRLLDVSLGGALAVIAYLVWPTSPRAGVSQAESRLFEGLHDYLSVVSQLVRGTTVSPHDIARSSKAVRVAWGKAEAAVGRSIEEPASTRIDPTEGRSLMSASMRILRVTHALRMEGERGVTVEGLEHFEALMADCLLALHRISENFMGESVEPVEDLRVKCDLTERELVDAGVAPSLALNLDELVNAINTAQHLCGLERAVPNP
ncbi:MAG: FUSC family protein [Acidimicrobiales bacterium]